MTDSKVVMYNYISQSFHQQTGIICPTSRSNTRGKHRDKIVGDSEQKLTQAIPGTSSRL